MADKAYRFGLTTLGELKFAVSPDGNSELTAVSSVAVAGPLNVPKWGRVLLDDVTGDVTFYTSTDPTDTDHAAVSWVQLGTVQNIGAVFINDSALPLTVGADSDGLNLFAGRIHGVWLDGDVGTPPPTLGNGFLQFAETSSPFQYLVQPSLDVETDLVTIPNTYFDLRMDWDYKSFDSSRNVAGPRGTGGGTTEWFTIYQNNRGFTMSTPAYTDWVSGLSDYWQTGRFQYRQRWEGTVLTIYRRDPILGLPLSDDASWTQFDQNLTMGEVSNIPPKSNLAFQFMKIDGNRGHVAFDLYGVWYEVDGNLESSFFGGAVTPNFGANTFTDEQGNTWTWVGVDPTQVPD